MRDIRCGKLRRITTMHTRVQVYSVCVCVCIGLQLVVVMSTLIRKVDEKRQLSLITIGLQSYGSCVNEFSCVLIRLLSMLSISTYPFPVICQLVASVQMTWR